MSEQIINIWKANGFVGLKKLKSLLNEQKIQITTKNLNELIKEQKTNQIHKDYKKKQKTLGHIITYAKNHNWQMDLSDMTMYQSKNHGYKYILLAVDVFTRKAYAQPIKNKTEKSVTEAFNKMIENEQPIKLSTDNGSEFINKEFQQVIEEKDINHVTAQVGDHNALGIIDRFTRTLKEMIHKHFTENNTINWVDNLQTTINVYNNLPHEGINGIKPNQAETKENDHEIRLINIEKSQDKSILDDTENIPKEEQTVNIRGTTFKIGDKVRIRIKEPFKKGYTPKWSEEIYTIKHFHKVTAVLSDNKKYHFNDIKLVIDNNEQNKEIPKPVEQAPIISELKKSKIDNKKTKNFEKSGLSLNDIIASKRVPKKNKKYLPDLSEN